MRHGSAEKQDTASPQVRIILACDHVIPPGAECMVSLADGRQVTCCYDCWNASVAARRAARKLELAARPRDCQRCASRPHTWIVARRYKLCGRCKTAVEREHRRAVAKLGSLAILGMTAPLFSTEGWASP